MKQVRGYTLVDVLFAMVFILTVVSMTTIGYSFLMRSSTKLTKSKSQVLLQARSLNSINSEIWRADSIRAIENTVTIFRDTISVQYVFEEEIIRKQRVRIDTLPIRVKEIIEGEYEIMLKVESLGETFTLSIPLLISNAEGVNQKLQEIGN